VLGRLCYIFGAVLLVCRFVVPSTEIVPTNLNVVAGGLLLAIGWILCRIGQPPAPP
jgi:hypothetical protein